MKYFLSLVFCSFASGPVAAWECDPIDMDGWSLERHIEESSDIVFGQVVHSKLVSNLSKKIALSVRKTIKGSLSGEQQFTIYSHLLSHEFVVGYSYIIFLYGNRHIDFCGFISEFPYYISSEEELTLILENPNIKKPIGAQRLLQIEP